MTAVWARRQEAWLRDGIVPSDVFHHLVDRLGDFVLPYHHALEAKARKRPGHLSLAALLSPLDRQHAETIAAFVEVERRGLQEFIGPPLGSSPVAHGVGQPRGRAVGGTRWGHRLCSQQRPPAGDACGGGAAPVGQPPWQSRSLPGGRLQGLRRALRPCRARLPRGPARGRGPGCATACGVPRPAGGAGSPAARAVPGAARRVGRAGAPRLGEGGR
jgi:hypothetical protein